jgi:hypothetical protein
MFGFVLTVVVVLLLTAVAASVALYRAARQAVHGYEDEFGFHAEVKIPAIAADSQSPIDGETFESATLPRSTRRRAARASAGTLAASK